MEIQMDYLCAPFSPDEFHSIADHRKQAIEYAKTYTKLTGKLIYIPHTTFMGEFDETHRKEILEFELNLIKNNYFEKIVICSCLCHNGLTVGMKEEIIAAVNNLIPTVDYITLLTNLPVADK
jgi:hypothetical protein